MSVVTVTMENFEAEVLKCEKPVLVDFWAEWCGPCKMMGPVISQLADEHPEYKFCKLNVDENMDLAKKYYVMSIPMFIVFKNGEVSRKNIGVIPAEDVMELFEHV